MSYPRRRLSVDRELALENKEQAEQVLAATISRMEEVGLRLHPDKKMLLKALFGCEIGLIWGNFGLRFEWGS